jgi:hypothetical protein
VITPFEGKENVVTKESAKEIGRKEIVRSYHLDWLMMGLDFRCAIAGDFEM